MIPGCDFPRKTPKSTAWRSNEIQGIGARGRFLTPKPESEPGSMKNIRKTNGFELSFSTSSKSHVKIPLFWQRSGALLGPIFIISLSHADFL